MPAVEEDERQADAELTDALSRIPNIPLDDVPVGRDENDNVVKRVHGTEARLESHAQGAFRNRRGARLAWISKVPPRLPVSRFTILKGQLARLERALGQFMLDLHTTEHGYTEVQPPLMVRDDAMYGTGQLPKFAEDLFQTTDGRWLIPTAEVPLTNLVAGADSRCRKSCRCASRR